MKPILFLTYNRPEATKEVFNQIKASRPKKLFIAQDAPNKNNANDHTKCRDVREIVQSVDWDCEIKELYSEEHIGSRKNVSRAINWFFEEVEDGIILEDDCVPNHDFFPFCHQMLNEYRNHDKVMSVGGFNFGFYGLEDVSYGFSRYMNMWGWATWRKEALEVDYELTEWESKSQVAKLNFLQNHLGGFDLPWFWFWKDIFDKVNKYQQFDCWDYQWIYHQFKKEKLSIFPKKNLIQNIGFNNQATHTTNKQHPLGDLSTERMTFPLLKNENVIPNLNYEELSIRSLWCNFSSLAYAKQKILTLLSKSNH